MARYLLNLILVSVNIFIFSAGSDAQKLSGLVTDSTLKKPLANVSVFLSSTTTGTTTDGQGRFELNNVPKKDYDLLVSCIGYQTLQVHVSAEQLNTILQIALTPKDIQLPVVDIHPDHNRERYLQMFREQFIGTSPQAKLCLINNEEVINLSYKSKERILSANSTEFLKIENRTLGYQLQFLLNDFTVNYATENYHYAGVVIFKELSGSKAQERKWEKARLQAYLGSNLHFFRTLCQLQSAQNGFTIHKFNRTINSQRPADSIIRSKIRFYRNGLQQHLNVQDSLAYWLRLFSLPKVAESVNAQTIADTSLVHSTHEPGINRIQFTDYLYVIYKNKHDLDSNNNLYQSADAKDHPTALVKMTDSRKPILFDLNGLQISKGSFYFEGSWDNKVPRLLPTNYIVP